MRRRWPGIRYTMRYTKLALALFGLGLGLGFVIVVIGGHPHLERVASTAMALGLVALPVGLFADGRGLAVLAWLARRRPRGRRNPAHRKPRAGGRKAPAKPPGAKSPAAERSAAKAPARSTGRRAPAGARRKRR